MGSLHAGSDGPAFAVAPETSCSDMSSATKGGSPLLPMIGHELIRSDNAWHVLIRSFSFTTKGCFTPVMTGRRATYPHGGGIMRAITSRPVTGKPMRCMLAVFGVLLPVWVQAQCLSPLQVSDDRRRIERTDGRAFFWTGDTACLLDRIPPDGVDLYLRTRAAQGFNVIQGPVLTHDEADNHYGERNTDPAEPNELFFTYIDTIIDKAAENCLYIAPVVTWSNSVQTNRNNAERTRTRQN